MTDWSRYHGFVKVSWVCHGMKCLSRYERLVKVMNGVAMCTVLDGTPGKPSIEIETCFCLEEKNPIEKVLFRWIP